jgi:hypothetical protein
VRLVFPNEKQHLALGKSCQIVITNLCIIIQGKKDNLYNEVLIINEGAQPSYLVEVTPRALFLRYFKMQELFRDMFDVMKVFPET